MKKETAKITIALSKDLLDSVKQKATEEEMTVSALVRHLLLNYTKEDSPNRKILFE